MLPAQSQLIPSTFRVMRVPTIRTDSELAAPSRKQSARLARPDTGLDPQEQCTHAVECGDD